MNTLLDSTTTFTVVVSGDPNSPVTWRGVSTDDDGNVIEDLTYTIPAERVPPFAIRFLQLAYFAFANGVETDNLVTSDELAAVEASFPTEGTFVTEGVHSPFGSQAWAT